MSEELVNQGGRILRELAVEARRSEGTFPVDDGEIVDFVLRQVELPAPAPERERRVLARGWVGYVGDAPEDDELLLFSVALTRAGSEAICDLYGRLPDGYRYVEIVEARPPAGEE